MTMLAIEKIKSCKECPYVNIYTYDNFTTYYCGKNDGGFISGQKLNPKVNIPKWCPLRKFGLIKQNVSQAKQKEV